MNQEHVKEIYLRVIDATVESVRTEMQEKNMDEASIESLSLLKQRWATRLTHTHDFTDDPEIIDKPASSANSKGGKKPTGKNAKKKGGASPKSPGRLAPGRNGAMSVAALTNHADDSAIAVGSVAASSHGKVEHSLLHPRDVKTEDEPAAKRPRPDLDDQPVQCGEDLDSSDDSDVNGNESDDEAAENLVLAQHDRVKKGPRWKVILKEGIVSIRGREYLFNKATCDLDF